MPFWYPHDGWRRKLQALIAKPLLRVLGLPYQTPHLAMLAEAGLPDMQAVYHHMCILWARRLDVMEERARVTAHAANPDAPKSSWLPDVCRYQQPKVVQQLKKAVKACSGVMRGVGDNDRGNVRRPQLVNIATRPLAMSHWHATRNDVAHRIQWSSEKRWCMMAGQCQGLKDLRRSAEDSLFAYHWNGAAQPNVCHHMGGTGLALSYYLLCDTREVASLRAKLRFGRVRLNERLMNHTNDYSKKRPASIYCDCTVGRAALPARWIVSGNWMRNGPLPHFLPWMIFLTICWLAVIAP